MPGNHYAVIAHAVISVAMLVGYVVLTALNHDADTLLGALAGYLGGASVTSAAVGANNRKGNP